MLKEQTLELEQSFNLRNKEIHLKKDAILANEKSDQIGRFCCFINLSSKG